jgi:hypothetical protein
MGGISYMVININNNSNQLDIKSLRSYGIHGALGLLMGIGAGLILGFILINIIISSLTADYSVMIDSIRQGGAALVTILVIYGFYGFYVGYIFGGQKKSSRISITCAAAGIFGGLVTAGLLAGEFIKTSGLLDPLFITLVFACPILGFPKIKDMVLMTGSGSIGAALSYGVYILGQNITVYLNSVWTQGLLALIIAFLFPLFAIGIAGASIAIGMYLTEGTAYTAREIPGFLKITRGAGIVLTLIVLVFSALISLSVAKYSTNDVSIDISSGGGNITVFVPVLLENGNLMEMYGKPAISGSATTEIIDTDYGKAFKISGSGSIRINMEQTGGFGTTDSLSTSNASRYGGINNPVEDAWVYSGEDGTMFRLSIIRDNGWGKQMTLNTEREVKLTRGWQVIRFSVRRLMYD